MARDKEEPSASTPQIHVPRHLIISRRGRSGWQFRSISRSIGVSGRRTCPEREGTFDRTPRHSPRRLLSLRRRGWGKRLYWDGMIHLDNVIVRRLSCKTTVTTTQTRDDLDVNDVLYYNLRNGLLKGSSSSSSTLGKKGEAAGNNRLHMAQPPTRGEPCGFVSGLELAIRYSIL